MTLSVPFINPRKHYSRYKSDIDSAIQGCLSQGDLIYRQQLKTFEEHLAAFVGVKHAVGVASGYHALHLSLVAAGIGAGCEVITVAHTFVATISAIVHAGAVPVLVDVGDDFNMDVSKVEAAITPRTRAIMPVHLNGRVADMDAIEALARKHHLQIFEDAAQSLGATWRERRAGSFGATGCFSFYPFKILGGFGDGGAVTTNDPKMARAISLLRYNGEDRETGEYHYHGYTALLDNVQAAVLDFKLTQLPSWVTHRRAMAALYDEKLAGVSKIQCPPRDSVHGVDAFQNYVIRSPRRDDLRKYLKSRGVETLIHWPKPVWEHLGLALPKMNLPITERLCKEVLSLPLSAETTPEEVDATAQAIAAFHG